MSKGAFVYILSSTYKHLYIGVTTELAHRIGQHKRGTFPDSFTSRYRIDQLVYVEPFLTINEAIPREKQLKRWSRLKKINLIVQQNPTWRDLTQDLIPKPPPLKPALIPLTPTSHEVISTEVAQPHRATQRRDPRIVPLLLLVLCQPRLKSLSPTDRRTENPNSFSALEVAPNPVTA